MKTSAIVPTFLFNEILNILSFMLQATYVHGKMEIEKLAFTNHTECECRERKDFGSTGDKPMDHRAVRHYPASPAPQNIVRAPTRKP